MFFSWFPIFVCISVQKWESFCILAWNFSVVSRKDQDDLILKGAHQKELHGNKVFLWLDIKCRATDSEVMTDFKEEDYARQLAKGTRGGRFKVHQKETLYQRTEIWVPWKKNKSRQVSRGTKVLWLKVVQLHATKGKLYEWMKNTNCPGHWN